MDLKIRKEAEWVRNDINKSNIDNSKKNTLISLSDKELVEIINKTEDEMIYDILKERTQIKSKTFSHEEFLLYLEKLNSSSE